MRVDCANMRDGASSTISHGEVSRGIGTEFGIARASRSIGESTDAQGKPLDYATVATSALTDSLAAANKEWSEAEAADSKYQELLRDVRAASAVFDLELQTFRRTLGNVAGRSDKDFQKLRAERASHRRGRPRSSCPACTCNIGR